jgi:protein phosphatase
MKLDVSALTDPGIKRASNEDYVWSQVFSDSRGARLALLIVCDGMGGHLGGECASYWAVETIKRELASLFCPADPRATVHLSPAEADTVRIADKTTTRMTDNDLERLVFKAIQSANRVVYQYAQQKPQMAADAGTTLTMAVIWGEKTLIANVGDSRTYLLRARDLRQVTEDHSLVARMVAQGEIEPQEIFVHPKRSMIYRSLGQKTSVKVDLFWETLEADDYLLLCSDGLWEMVRDPAAIVEIVEDAPSLDDACRQLVAAANLAGGDDNISVVLASIT